MHWDIQNPQEKNPIYSCNANLKENSEVTHNKDRFLKKTKIFSVYGCHLFAFILLDAVKGKNRFAAEQVTLLSPFCPEMNV